MKLSEQLQVIRRAGKYTFRVNRKYTLLLIASAFLSSMIGYIPIYFLLKLLTP